jgi:hypothetical protein
MLISHVLHSQRTNVRQGDVLQAQVPEFRPLRPILVLEESPSLSGLGDQLVDCAYKRAMLHASMLASCQ